MFIHLFDFLKTLGQKFVLEPPMIYFIVRLFVSEASFGTFVIRMLSYTAYRCTDFFQQFSFVCCSNERMKKCKSVNLLFFPGLCCSNCKQVQLNLFSLSSLISQIRKSVTRQASPMSFKIPYKFFSR